MNKSKARTLVSVFPIVRSLLLGLFSSEIFRVSSGVNPVHVYSSVAFICFRSLTIWACLGTMDIISQLQEQVNMIAALAFNTFGTLQRDAPPVRLSPNYREPVAPSSDDTINIAEQPKLMSAALVQAAKQVNSPL